MFPSSYHDEIFGHYYQWQKWCPCKKSRSEVKRSRSQRSKSNLAVSGPKPQFGFAYDDEMVNKAYSSIEEVPYCFSRASVQFQDHTGQTKITDFDPNWVFPDFNTSLNSPMALWNYVQSLKWHRRGAPLCSRFPSNFKSTKDNKTLILTRIESFRTVTPIWIHRWLWNDAQSLT